MKGNTEVAVTILKNNLALQKSSLRKFKKEFTGMCLQVIPYYEKNIADTEYAIQILEKQNVQD